jgi:GT2 family glycosyltransferase
MPFSIGVVGSVLGAPDGGKAAPQDICRKAGVCGQGAIELTAVSEPRVTVVVVQRERLSPVKQTLDRLLESLNMPHRLIYVDGGSPRRLARWLRERADEHGFEILRVDHHLVPSEARNLGLAEAKTELVALIDNDVVVEDGWLERLIECLDETGGAAVGPLTCEGEPLGERVHFAGGEVRIEEDENGARHVRDRMFHAQRKLVNVRDELKRQPVTLLELHTMLVRRELIDEVGGLDEQLSTRYHLDWCMRVVQAGKTLWFEPSSVVHYVPGPPRDLADAHFYMLRWSDAWERHSLEHFRQKWDLADDEFFRARLGRLGWRRQMTVIDPIFRRVLPGKLGGAAVRAAKPPERLLNRIITRRHARARARTHA